MRRLVLIIFVSCMALSLSPATGWAKKKKNAPPVPAAQTEAEKRVQNLTGDELRQFESLSDEQKNLISKGKIDEGFNAWMVKVALGEPFYGTEHHPIFTDYEEVWLYVKPDVLENITENRIIDPQTNWPTLHRKIETKICQVTDFFVLWDRGVVQDVHTVTDKKVQGSCTLETREEFLPIVDGKPVRP